MSFRIISLGISSEQDVVIVRQRTRQISALLGFAAQDQVRIATAVSEVSRTACAYSTGGRVDISVIRNEPAPSLEILIKDTGGPLRATLATAMTDYSQDETLDDALVTAHRLMDSCSVNDEAGRARIIQLRKSLPPGTKIDLADLNQVVNQISASPVSNTYTVVQLQNKELLDTLAELRSKQDDLLALTQKLEDTNRGIVALNAEIEEKAERLRHADEMKSRFLSNTSHELRTPLSSIRALLQIVLKRANGDLTSEQEKQLRLVQNSVNDLSELVNDLLDLAKVESGKIAVNCMTFSVSNLFSALRGIMRPLTEATPVELIFAEPDFPIKIYSDEGKLSQILRNLISNAIKFTEQGSVTVAAFHDMETDTVKFSVTDTGIGIAPENLKSVFEEFSQVPNPLQGRTKGTGLGLPLCRQLASLLGGYVELDSKFGVGSTFTLILPMHYESK